MKQPRDTDKARFASRDMKFFSTKKMEKLRLQHVEYLIYFVNDTEVLFTINTSNYD